MASEVADAGLGPGFEFIEEGAVEVGKRGEGEIGEGVFVGVDGIGFDVNEMDDAEMDLADASLVWLAQDTNTLNIMTMDVRDFSRYRLPDGRRFVIH